MDRLRDQNQVELDEEIEKAASEHQDSLYEESLNDRDSYAGTHKFGTID